VEDADSIFFSSIRFLKFGSTATRLYCVGAAISLSERLEQKEDSAHTAALCGCIKISAFSITTPFYT
jgi:hypothetical protein